MEFTIGKLAQKTGCKVVTIRYYEKIGLLPSPPRSAGNRRLYGPEHTARLGFIQHGRELGFSQKAIRELLNLYDNPEHSCEAVTEIASNHLEEIDKRFVQLAALKFELERMITSCAGGRIAQCRIIETFADHSIGNCLGENDGTS